MCEHAVPSYVLQGSIGGTLQHTVLSLVVHTEHLLARFTMKNMFMEVSLPFEEYCKTIWAGVPVRREIIVERAIANRDDSLPGRARSSWVVHNANW